MKNKKNIVYYGLISALCLFVGLFTIFLYIHDNKYTAVSPTYIEGLQQINFNEKSLLVLDEHWQVYAGNVAQQDFNAEPLPHLELKIGDYARFNVTEITYRTLINNPNHQDMNLSLFIQELHEGYTILLNKQVIHSGTYNCDTSLLLQPGVNELLVVVQGENHYYQGMVYPPILGTSFAMMQHHQLKNVFYSFMLISTLTILLYTLTLWNKNRVAIYRHFGLFCLSFCFYILHYFVHTFKIPYEAYFYLVEDIAFYAMIWFVVKIVAETCGLIHTSFFKNKVRPCFAIIATLCIILYCLLPLQPSWVKFHSMFINLYQFLVIFFLIFALYTVIRQKKKISYYILIGSCVFICTLFFDMFMLNQFEPFYLGWLMEYGAYFLVLIFAIMLVRLNFTILEENQNYKMHLEELVDKKTEQLQRLIEQRRNYFIQTTHDLKAPVNMISHYIDELRQEHPQTEYLAILDNKLQDMSNRVSAINTFNQIDYISEPSENISVNELLKEVEKDFLPDAEVMDLELIVHFLKQDTSIFIQHEKMIVVFENLFYNALRYTPAGKKIIITAILQEKTLLLKVQDEGKGIAAEHLDNLFTSFYTAKDELSGNGIGLFLVKTLVEEMHGSIEVQSEIDQGTTFTIIFSAF